MSASRRQILQGGCALLPSALGLIGPAAYASVAAPGFVDAPWSRLGSVASRQAEALRRLPLPTDSEGPSPLCDWRVDAELANLSSVPEAVTLLDADEADDRRRFTLDAAALWAMFKANRLDAAIGQDGLVLFALRGCVIESPAFAGVLTNRVKLRVVRTDNMTPRCVIGVWRRDQDQLAVFSGSTVPNRHALALQVAAFDRGKTQSGQRIWRVANTLSSGLHSFTRGRHGGWHPAAFRAADLQSRAMRQPGLRSVTGAFSIADVRLDDAVIMDNIHPGLTPADAYGAGFSSEGCLTVVERATPDRWSVDPPDWTAFSRVSELATSAGRGRAWKMGLLSGADAWLAANGVSASRLRYGSRGPEVTALRRSLRLASAGAFDAQVMARVMEAGQGPVVVVP